MQCFSWKFEKHYIFYENFPIELLLLVGGGICDHISQKSNIVVHTLAKLSLVSAGTLVGMETCFLLLFTMYLIPIWPDYQYFLRFLSKEEEEEDFNLYFIKKTKTKTKV